MLITKEKLGELVERHVDKIAFIAVGILCVYLLWTFVIGSPCAVEYGGRKLGPGEIDNYIKSQADKKAAQLDEDPETKIYTKNYGDKFLSSIGCSVTKINDNSYYYLPGVGDKPVEDRRSYHVPDIGEVSDVAVEAIRTVVYLPTEEVSAENTYSQAEMTSGDLDFVTIEASFGIAELYKNFQQSFSGMAVRPQWRDDRLAEPIFASVELQRCQLADEGKWSQWQVVDRTKIDHYKTLLDIPDNVSELKYDMRVLKLRLKGFEVQKNILQPAAYDIAVSDERWLTPRLHKEYVKIHKLEKEQASRKERELLKEKRERQKEESKRSGGRERSSEGRSTGSRGGSRERSTRRTTDRRKEPDSREEKAAKTRSLGTRQSSQRTVADIVADFEKLLITERTMPANMRDGQLVFWAHDDTIEPGNSYQYRIRIGVFNPIAGHEWFENGQEEYKDKVILWSPYSEPTEPVHIAERMYFFPLAVSKDDEKSITAQVSRFYLGRWRSEKFTVRPGEMIGAVVTETKTERDKLYDGQPDADTVDYSTGMVLVDIVETKDWAGANALRQREYKEILYTEDGTTIKHLPARKMYWPAELTEKFTMIAETDSTEPATIERGRGAGQ